MAAAAVCYGAQQKERNDGTREEYAQANGNGDRVTEFTALDVAEPRPRDEELLPPGAVVPVAPESGDVLPVRVTEGEVDEAIAVLAEFPAEPVAEKPGAGATVLLDSTRVRAARKRSEAGTESPEETTVLFVSDTHLGYENRAKTGYGKTVSWIDAISSLTTVSRIADIALARDVDAVVHTGDILDHEVDDISLHAAEAALRTLSMEGISVYCIIGTHDHGSKHPSHPGSVDGVAWLQRQVEQGHLTELTMDSTRVADSGVDAYGISASNIGIDDVGTAYDWSFSEIAFGASSPGPNVLCLHESTSLFRGQDADLDIEELLAQSRVEFDCILIGDEHSPKDDDFDTGYTFRTDDGTPVHYTGPAIRLNDAYQDREAFVTELTISADGVTARRHDL
ncbi:metallophosphoesterase [Salinibaculum rarum]|uniref:metallophosphoesterase n=1 Tax=Salinibaculum rarum TaxID=3058903 RepID=UPI00265F1ED1|nr:metallophosphoesterase [Salinibaculum sp. KK48]